MSVEFEDKTGEPMSARDFEDAVAVVTKHMVVSVMMTLPPELAVQLGNIRRCLVQGALLTARNMKEVIR